MEEKDLDILKNEIIKEVSKISGIKGFALIDSDSKLNNLKLSDNNLTQAILIYESKKGFAVKIAVIATLGINFKNISTSLNQVIKLCFQQNNYKVYSVNIYYRGVAK
ncbi:hypothetical protein ACW95P_03755 [Candidatus Mycoplasma pogonae]